MITKRHDESRRRRLDLLEQKDAYRYTMADPSMVFGGRDVVSYYRAKLKESMQIKSEAIKTAPIQISRQMAAVRDLNMATVKRE